MKISAFGLSASPLVLTILHWVSAAKTAKTQPTSHTEIDPLSHWESLEAFTFLKPMLLLTIITEWLLSWNSSCSFGRLHGWMMRIGSTWEVSSWCCWTVWINLIHCYSVGVQIIRCSITNPSAEIVEAAKFQTATSPRVPIESILLIEPEAYFLDDIGWWRFSNPAEVEEMSPYSFGKTFEHSRFILEL